MDDNLIANETPLITILTPAYRKSDLIFSTINSVLAQNYKKIEYIIIDDSPSTLKNLKIEDYIMSHGQLYCFKMITHAHNMGVSASLNDGVRSAHGKYIFNIADDDCFFDPNVISDWVQEFETSGSEIITAKRAVYSHTLTEFYKIEPDLKIKELICSSSPRQLFESMTGYNYIFGCVTASTRSLLLKFPYNEQYSLIEDYPFVLKILRNDIRIHFFDRIVIKYRLGGMSDVQNITKKYLSQSNKIFIYEILPYTKHPIRSIKKYIQWKHYVEHNKLS